MQTTRSRAAAIIATLLLSGFAVGLAQPALAAAPRAPSVSVRGGVDDFTFSSFDADYYLDRDASGHSTLKTVEHLTAQFPSTDQNKGIVRKIPDDYLGSSLHTAFVSVSDTNGVTQPYSVTDDGTYTTVETGTDAYLHGAVTYTLTYTQTNVAGQFSDTNDQEFYWDTNGTQWTQPFGEVVARVHIAPALVTALSGHNSCYQGAQGSTQQCTIGAPPSASPVPTLTPGATATYFPAETIISASATGLAAGENMTVAIGFANGTFVDAPQASNGDTTTEINILPDTAWGGILWGILILLGLGGLVFAIVYRAAFGQRNAKGRGTIIPQYDVPTGLNVMEAASILKLDSRSLPAQLVSFAVRGNLRILAYPITNDSGADYTLEFTTADGLDAEETQLMRAFFPELTSGATFEVVAAAVETSDITAVRATVAAGTVQKGWRIKASSRGGVIIVFAVVALLIVDILLVGIPGGASALADLTVAVTVVAGLVAAACAYRGFVLTPVGADRRDYLRGMQLYLTVAEADRIRILQSPTGAERINYDDKRQVVQLYEKLLPFAVLFDIEDQWAEVLAVQYSTATITPNWYVSNGAFSAALFVSSMSSLSDAVGASTMPVAASGGGSGFGGSFGGGFSGGGGGGGGGGGR